jgi:hypothetical protein
VRTLLVVAVVEASAGLLSAQAAPASDKDTPTTLSALPRRLFREPSLERPMAVLLQRSFVSDMAWYQPRTHRSM